MALFQNSTIVLARLVLGGLLSLIVTASLARALPPAQFGSYALLTLIPAIALNFFGFGLASSAVYFVSRDVKNQAETASGLLGVNLFLGLALMPIVLILVLVSGFSERSGLSLSPVLYLTLAIPFFFVNAAYTSVFHGMQNFRAGSIAALVPNASLVVFLAVFGVVTELTVSAAAGLYAMSHVVTFFALWFIRPRGVSLISSPWVFVKWFDRRHQRYALSVYAGNVLAFLNARAVVFVVGFFSTAENVAAFVALVALYEVLLFGATSIATVLLPWASRSKSENASISLTTIAITKIALLLTASVSVLLCLNGPAVLSALYGDFYRSGVDALWAFAVAACSATYLRILAAEVAGRGRPQKNTYIALIGSVVCVIGVSALSALFGVFGAAIGFAIAATVQASMTIHAFCQITGTRLRSLVTFSPAELRMMRSWFGRFRHTY
jgi:O-antigen/teichoic acid export membrane protein